MGLLCDMHLREKVCVCLYCRCVSFVCGLCKPVKVRIVGLCVFVLCGFLSVCSMTSLVFIV